MRAKGKEDYRLGGRRKMGGRYERMMARRWR
jgi:hypothetical protein